MNALRWLLHCLRCHWYRLQARDALADVRWSRNAQIEARNRMARALAREEEEQRAWRRWNQRVQRCAD
jgi:hypothetical protein